MGRTLLIDNYDSYTYLIYHKLWELSGIQPILIKNDALSLEAIQQLDFQNIVLSPGPGTPSASADIGIAPEVLTAYPDMPILGVCLGHQLLGDFFGATVSHAPRPMHGKYSNIALDDSPLFANMPRQIEVVRYHSLIVEEKGLPEDLKVIARNTADGLIMGLQHRERPWFGVQFHPESIGTEFGERIFANFLQSSQQWSKKGVLKTTVSERRFRKTAFPQHEPESVFAHLFAEAEHAIWLDSSLPGYNAHFSFMGEGRSVLRSSDPQQLAQLLQQNIQTDGFDDEDKSLPFKGGWMGYWDYDQEASMFMWVDRFLAWDHDRGEMWVCTASPNASTHATFVAEIREKLQNCPLLPALKMQANAGKQIDPSEIAFAQKRSRDEYIQDIEAIQDLIRDGESYEVCLTNEFFAELELEPFALYRVLRLTNPAPFAAFVKTGDQYVLSSSPESFVDLRSNAQIRTEPIKGTRPIGQNEKASAQIAAELRASDKDHAELLMIIDLLRNDLSMICEVGSVQVPELVRITRYATLMQASSIIEGKLLPEIGPVEAIQTIFPGGSITGAPKKRTMEIIERF
ncbi:MAG: chorismate-binding protein, partial [Bacteroidota bacterium]